MKFKPILLLAGILLIISCTENMANKVNKDTYMNDFSAESMLIRISEIEVYPEYLTEYLDAAKNVGATSVKEEEGVICIFPMQVKRDSSLIRIVEIYASDEAYKHHIQTAHFLKYKTGTLHMVKDLDLVDMNALDPENMALIFGKMQAGHRQAINN